MTGTGREVGHDGGSCRPDTAPMAAKRFGMAQANSETMYAPSENPLA